ncbi:MAG TPA: hypothetical protein VEY88_13555 [Archangium sp.]|nr:hypothetical protein [Archangium sp.]
MQLKSSVEGGSTCQPQPDLSGFQVATYTKPNSEGIKTERPNIRIVPQRVFKELTSIAALSDWLFGAPPG